MPGSAWKVEEARARFSELVRLARQSGPQHISVRGRDAVVLMSAEDYARLAPAGAAPSLTALFGTGPFARMADDDLGTTRERSPVRELPDFETRDGA